MCGIAGVIHWGGQSVNPTHVRAMTDAIAHRGPDGAGQWIQGPVGLGHTRLSIIDLTDAGRQPMASPDGRFIMVYNGEVYNFRELRAQLEVGGYSFKSQTDSEVVLAAWVEWGEASVARLNGMFAFAIWDTVDSRLWLARDRYGIKPLYVGRQGPWLAFGSEQKAILALPSFAKEPDFHGVMEYLNFQNFLSTRTLTRGISTLPAGSVARYDFHSRSAEPRVHRYWDFDFEQPSGHPDPREYSEELDRLFRQAVERQLVSDVEVGSFLSGGIDSGSITAVASKSRQNWKTFTVGFDLSSASGIELGFDERVYAEEMSAAFKTEHFEMVLKAGDLQRVMTKLAFHLEEPRVGQSYPNFYASSLASRFVKVVLAGTGGDELFGGYPWRYIRDNPSGSFEDFASRYFARWQRLATDVEIRSLLRPVWSSACDLDVRAIFTGVLNSRGFSFTTSEDCVNASLYFESKTFLHGLLVVEDKLSMAHGLETRVPFLDNDLVDFAMRCPVQLKLSDVHDEGWLDENEPGNKTERYFAANNDGKRILREVMRDYLPSSVSERRKQGFSSPDASWFRGESLDYVRDRLVLRPGDLGEILDLPTVAALMDDHLSGRRNRRLLIWSLLSLREWLDQG